MTSLPPEAVDHLYPFLVLAGVALGALAALVGIVWRGARAFDRGVTRGIAAAYGPNERGEPGVAARITSEIVERAFAGAINPLLTAVHDVEKKADQLGRDLEDHEAREDARQAAAAESLKVELRAELSRLVEQATRFPAAVLRKTERIEAVQAEQGKRIDSHEERILRLEASQE